MSFPKLIIDLEKIKNNALIVAEESAKRNYELIGVEKLVAGDLEVAKTLIDAGIKTLADSRIKNLLKLKDLQAKKMLLRIPMLSEIDELVDIVDVCLISEIQTIIEINKKAKKVIEIILMIETGDIREGLYDKEIIFSTVEKIKELKNIKLVGLGTNFACFGATVPSVNKMIELVALKNEISKKFDIIMPKISAGSSSHFTIWDDKKLPVEVNQIRVGAAILMGIGLNDEPIDFLQQNIFTLQAEIVEIQNKPSASWGEKGLDAFGREKHFDDIGIRKKAIVALGRQDCPYDEITPVKEHMKILGQSSDHTILDITDYEQELKIGSIIEFKLSYLAVLSLITSEYVAKTYKK
ncbi:alanine racemase [Mesoplasma photuris]|uniref:alanine racemase n=1 Tax=Mesoplasma photuris TaxID=217731 RepID=UPI0004E2266E|nr:alanine racemase [Mesoplasma photuris]